MWEMRNCTFGFGFGFRVWLFITMGVENGCGGWRTKNGIEKMGKGKKGRERERGVKLKLIFVFIFNFMAFLYFIEIF